MPEIIFKKRTPAERLIELQLDYNQKQIENCRSNIAFCNGRINFGEPTAKEIEFCKNIIDRATQSIRDLSFERRALQLKLENERR